MRLVLLVCLLVAVVGPAFADGIEITGPLERGSKVRIGKVDGIILRVTDDGVYVKIRKSEVKDSDDPETLRLVELYKDTSWDHYSGRGGLRSDRRVEREPAASRDASYRSRE